MKLFGQALLCSVIFGTPTTLVISGKQQALALSGSFRTSRPLSSIGLTVTNVLYAKHIASMQSLSSPCLPNNARRFLQTEVIDSRHTLQTPEVAYSEL